MAGIADADDVATAEALLFGAVHADRDVSALLYPFSEDELGALLEACRRLTRQVRVELRRRAWAREDAPAEAAEEAGDAG